MLKIRGRIKERKRERERERERKRERERLIYVSKIKRILKKEKK